MECKQQICVAICSRRRRDMLKAAVQSLAMSSVPHGARVCILVVENDTAAMLEQAELQALADEGGQGVELAYILCPEIGIANARNAALDYARSYGFDWLAFIDDDETVGRDWLAQLLAAARVGSFVLTGGPVRPVAAMPLHGLLRLLMWNGYYRQRMRHYQRDNRTCDAGRGQKITIITNNWLFDLRAPETKDLSFDRRLDTTGGEDTDFFRRLKRRGASSGWAPKAIVYETIPSERLTVKYQFRRAAHQRAVRLRGRIAGRGMLARGAIIGLRGSIDMLAAVFHVVLVVPTLGWTLFDAVRYAGATVGDLSSLRPRGKGFYDHVTGE